MKSFDENAFVKYDSLIQNQLGLAIEKILKKLIRDFPEFEDEEVVQELLEGEGMRLDEFFSLLSKLHGVLAMHVPNYNQSQ